jgi:hypothetical protein
VTAVKKLNTGLVKLSFRAGSGLSWRFGHADIVRAGASGFCVDGSWLGCVSEALPVNKSPSDLLRGKLLDQAHRASAARARLVRKPWARRLSALLRSKGSRGRLLATADRVVGVRGAAGWRGSRRRCAKQRGNGNSNSKVTVSDLGQPTTDSIHTRCGSRDASIASTGDAKPNASSHRIRPPHPK